MPWYVQNALLVVGFSAVHMIGTTDRAKSFISRSMGSKPFLWNFGYNIITVAAIIVMILLWKKSDTVLWRASGMWFWVIVGINLSLNGLFLWLFRYTQPFGEWLGITQLVRWLRGEDMSKIEGYRLKKHGIKRYVRFPHHTALIGIFWCLPVMRADLALLAVGMTLLAWLGTVHQDTRGLRYIGEPWAEYRKTSRILFPALELVVQDVQAWRLRVAAAQTAPVPDETVRTS